MEVSTLTNLVPSSLLVQATFVPVSYDCPRGELMKNLYQEERTKPNQSRILWGVSCSRVSNRIVSQLLTNISQPDNCYQQLSKSYIVKHGTARHGTAQHSTAQQCTAQHSTSSLQNIC